MRAWLSRNAPELAFAALLLLGLVIIMRETRGLSLYFDDWDFVLRRRGFTPDTLLRPHGPHLVLIPILIYKTMLQLFGGGSYLPFRVLAALDLILVAGVLGFAARRFWGPWWGLAPVLLLVTLGSGGWTLLWSFQVGFAIATASGIAALLALEASRRGSKVLACALLLVSLASGSQGIGFLVGAALLLVLRRRARADAWVVIQPAVLYLLWYAKYGRHSSETYLSLWHYSLPYTLKALSSTISGVLGLGSPDSQLPPQLDPSFGEPLALLAVGAVVIGALRGWRPPRLFWSLIATLLFLWIAASLTNVNMNRRPTDSRYLATSAALLMVCVCVALPKPRLRGAGAATIGAYLLVVCATNLGSYDRPRHEMLATGEASRAELGAMLVLRGLVPPYFKPEADFGPALVNDVNAGSLYSAVDSFGVLADSPSSLRRQGEGTRELADQVLGRGEALAVSFAKLPTSTATPPPTLLGGSATAERRCVTLSASTAQVALSPGVFRLRGGPGSSLVMTGARLAGAFTVPVRTLLAGSRAELRIPSDGLTGQSWRLQLQGSGQICA